MKMAREEGFETTVVFGPVKNFWRLLDFLRNYLHYQLDVHRSEHGLTELRLFAVQRAKVQRRLEISD